MSSAPWIGCAEDLTVDDYECLFRAASTIHIKGWSE